MAPATIASITRDVHTFLSSYNSIQKPILKLRSKGLSTLDLSTLDLSTFDYRISIEPQEKEKQERVYGKWDDRNLAMNNNVPSQNNKNNKMLEPYYKSLINYYLLVYPWLNDIINLYDRHSKEDFALVEQLIKCHKKENNGTNYDFNRVIITFYRTAYPEICESVKQETEGQDFESTIQIIKQRINNYNK
ncbi:MAG: hypothetical protein WCX73_05265 [Candidatus Pacearchaeota archaeon]|jgi:hypothetical protein